MKKIYCIILLALLCWRYHASAQIVTVGSGSYTTQLPPPDAAGRNVNPTGTPRLSGAAVSKPVVSSDWWTGLLTFDNANVYNYPMSLRAITNGLVVSYTTPGLGADDTRQPMSGDQPVVVGVSGLSVTNPTVSDYSDWTVTAGWASGGHTFNAIIGMGMPFVYCTKGSSDVASVTINMGTVSVQSEMILVTNSLGGSNFAIYAPVGSTWTQSGTTYTSTLAAKNYFSVAMLPQGASATVAASDFKQYAYVFPANTAVTWLYDNAASVARSTFTVTPDKKEGTGNSVLLGLLPHQWAHLSSSSAQPGSYSYTTVRGTMKMVASNTFVVENKFQGVLPTLPNTAKNSSGFDPGALSTKIDQVKGDGLQLWTDSYNDGLAMNRLIQVAKIADQQGNTAARDQIIATVKARLESWLKADAGENAFLFYYNSTWSTLIGYPAGYYSDANLNDHHFHYGYFISAAAAVEEFQPGWASNWGGMVNMLVKDAANWDKTDPKFPFLRNFCPYAGHSFATGLLNNEPHGNNQESSSEAMNFNASLIHWGTLTGNTAIRDLGIYLYTTEQTAIDEYYFNVNNRNFASTYAHPIVSRVWGNGYDRGTFWTNDIAATYGIEMVPLTGSSFYLGQNQTYVTKLWNDMKANTGVLSNTPNDNLWYDVYWSYLAFIDPASAITLYNNYQNRAIKNGESDANTYNWLHAFNGAGQIDGTVTANYPIAAVFNKAGNKTYVAHNYGASAITVTYSDGFSMSVPARTMKTSKDIDATATLVSSSAQIPANGTVTLTATVGGTVTKVEFYNGTSLIGTKTSAPYTLTTATLPAGKPNFYVKVYNGTSFNLSNVVKVLVGSQLPYGGTAWAVPGTFEAGSYDLFEGGVGQDVSYFDTDVVNQAGSFRSPEYVDAGPTTGEGNTVGWINDGEWLEYTVNVATAGTYSLNIRYTSGNASGGGPFWFENAAGTKISLDITVTMNDASWTAYTDKAVTAITLAAGVQVIRIKVGTGGFNLGKITFTNTGGSVSVTGVTMSPTSAS
ncbi:MAG TPA: glycosyl hydrolase, partial [Cyclobacteriaceae bacterium]|nr:glycosyl hydrolase [Cyclobacteriaceae bacterium]